MFSGGQRPRLQFVFGQSALTYLDGLPEVKVGQVARLEEVSALPGVEIRVISGLHAAMDGAFTIIEPHVDGLGEPFVSLDSADGLRYVEDPDVVSYYQRAFARVFEFATPLEEYLK